MDLATITVVIGAIAALSGVSAAATFLFHRGKAEAKVDAAENNATRAVAMVSLIGQQLSDYKEFVAREYITASSMVQFENRLTTELHRMSDDMKSSVTNVGNRVDGFAKTLIETLAAERRIN